MSDTVLFDVENGVASLTLNRPDLGNAINSEMADRLAELAARCHGDRAIRCVVLTGAGKLFCAGGDIGAFREAGDTADALLYDLAGTLHQAVTTFAHMAKPLLVLVNGPAAGAGFSLALAGDVVLGARSAHYTAAYGGIGLAPDGGMSWLLPRLVGLRRAQEIILTNRRIKADEAERIGIVTRLVDDEVLAREGAATALQLANAATGTLARSRTLLRQSFESGLEIQLERERHAISSAGGSPEAREGFAAYFEKRPPDFRKA
jgi:2-(1,2-epoxy-1,2-dihydrophenyl)acetyl-CoA isomerase